MQEWYSIEQIADRLDLHVRTVRGYVRDGRLNAVRIGKQYRVSRADFEALTGQSTVLEEHTPRVEVSTVFEVDGIDSEAVDRIAALIDGLPRGPKGPPVLHIQTVRDPERGRLKLLTTGQVQATVELLRFVTSLVEDETK